jgi:hypothetical protein
MIIQPIPTGVKGDSATQAGRIALPSNLEKKRPAALQVYLIGHRSLQNAQNVKFTDPRGRQKLRERLTETLSLLYWETNRNC